MKSHESDTMSNRIVHISVQLFSNEELARRVTEECHLLDIMVTVLLYMMESCLIKSELQGKLSKCVITDRYRLHKALDATTSLALWFFYSVFMQQNVSIL